MLPTEDQLRRAYLILAYMRNGNCMSDTSVQTGISIRAVENRMKRYGRQRRVRKIALTDQPPEIVELVHTLDAAFPREETDA